MAPDLNEISHVDHCKRFNSAAKRVTKRVRIVEDENNHNSDKPQIKLLHKDVVVPVRATSGSAGMDLHAYEKCTVPPNESRLINLGFEMSLPTGVYARIAPRSGLALKHSIQIDAGVIDRDYRGEVKALLRNNCQTSFNINKGDRLHR